MLSIAEQAVNKELDALHQMSVDTLREYAKKYETASLRIARETLGKVPKARDLLLNLATYAEAYRGYKIAQEAPRYEYEALHWNKSCYRVLSKIKKALEG